MSFCDSFETLKIGSINFTKGGMNDVYCEVSSFCNKFKMIYILTVKKRRNWHRHDYSEHDDSGKVNIQQVLLMLLGIKPSLSSVGFYISKVTLFISF